MAGVDPCCRCALRKAVIQRKKLTDPACAEALSGAEEDGTKERVEDNAGGLRVERRVRLTRV